MSPFCTCGSCFSVSNFRWGSGLQLGAHVSELSPSPLLKTRADNPLLRGLGADETQARKVDPTLADLAEAPREEELAVLSEFPHTRELTALTSARFRDASEQFTVVATACQGGLLALWQVTSPPPPKPGAESAKEDRRVKLVLRARYSEDNMAVLFVDLSPDARYVAWIDVNGGVQVAHTLLATKSVGVDPQSSALPPRTPNMERLMSSTLVQLVRPCGEP